VSKKDPAMPHGRETGGRAELVLTRILKTGFYDRGGVGCRAKESCKVQTSTNGRNRTEKDRKLFYIRTRGEAPAKGGGYQTAIKHGTTNRALALKGADRFPPRPMKGD